MVDENALRGILLHFIKRQKAIHKMLILTMAETASLRETVRALDPTFEDVLTQKREEFHLKLDALYQADMNHYEDLIKALEAGDVC